MEGDGRSGTPRAVGVIAMGRDPVAVDATCARLIGIDPARIPYLSTASSFLGNIDVERVEQRGERLDRYQTNFEVPDTFKDRKLDRSPVKAGSV
jgi:uncharacterized protein (DUF362 family)